MGNGAVRRLAWRLDEERWDDSVAVVYRVPLDGSPVSVVQTFGEPINQFSFDETPDGLRVFVEDWKEEQERREVYWLEIPMSSFSSTLSELPTERQHLLNVLEDGFTGQSRFIGPYLLYSEVDWTDPALDLWKLWVKRLDRDTPPVSFDFDTRRIQRIEPLGNHAVIIVEDEEDLDASTIWLGDNAQFGSTIFFPRAVEADFRSHGFNFTWSDTEGGVFGLPVFQSNDDIHPRSLNWNDDPVEVKFVGVTPNLNLFHIGKLRSDEALLDIDDDCFVSCVDWYGAARPFFIDDRVFALIDYELIEATGLPSAISEVERVNALSVLGN
jgi:hypothetical protein